MDPSGVVLHEKTRKFENTGGNVSKIGRTEVRDII